MFGNQPLFISSATRPFWDRARLLSFVGTRDLCALANAQCSLTEAISIRADRRRILSDRLGITGHMAGPAGRVRLRMLPRHRPAAETAQWTPYLLRPCKRIAQTLKQGLVFIRLGISMPRHFALWQILRRVIFRNKGFIVGNQLADPGQHQET